MIDGIRVIDFHAHSARWDSIGMKNDPILMLHAMDSAGIDMTCLNDPFCPDGITGNDGTARFVTQYPERFIGTANVSPLMPERMIPELTRAIDELKFRAIKVYSPNTPWDLGQSQWYPIYEFANERGLSMLFHTGPSPLAEPKHLARVVPLYPRAVFVIGHSGNDPEQRAQAIALAQAHPNVYLETCSTFRTPGVIEQLVNEAGADRVLFGSDMPLMDPRPQLGKIITARISDEAKRKILGDNACRLLGL